MKTLDRIFGCLMFLGGIGHASGAVSAYRNDRMTLLWALSASFAVFEMAALNLLRTARPNDRVLASLSFVACLIWIVFVIWFGALMGNMFDFRVLTNLVITVVLAAFSLRTAVKQVQ